MRTASTISKKLLTLWVMAITALGLTLAFVAPAFAEDYYVITISDYALSTKKSDDTYSNKGGGSQSYVYSGLAGVEYKAESVDDSIRWIFEETDGGYYIKSTDGKYLNATYTTNNNGAEGVLKLDDTKDVWSFDEGISLDGGTIDSTHLRSANASKGQSSDKFLAFQKRSGDSSTDKEINLFTTRSKDKTGAVENAKIEKTDGGTPVVPVSNVILDHGSLDLTTGGTGTLVATVEPDNATDKTVVWSSDDPTVATVDQNGNVTAVGPGETYIHAKAGDQDVKCKVTVEDEAPEVKSIELDADSLELDEGDTATLTATVDPADAEITWASSDPTVATVDENGVVTAVGEGTAEITATAGDKTATCEVTVKGDEPVVEGQWIRVSGKDRYKTMSAIVDKGFTTSDWAVVATGDNFPDALVASSLAGSKDCPVILTAKNELSPEAEAKLKSLKVKNVYIMGGTGAVSQDVEDAITDLGIEATRVKGAGRQATSLAAMDLLSGYDTIVVATGGAFADALSIGPWCYATQTPILLTDQGQLSDEQYAAIEAANPSRVIIVGGTGAVPQEVEDALNDMGIETVGRLSGKDRYRTSTIIAFFSALTQELDCSHAAVATGKNFPDALAGAALCGHNGSVLMLMGNTDIEGDGYALNLLEAASDRVVEGYVLGGTGVVSDEILDYLNNMNSSDA